MTDLTDRMRTCAATIVAEEFDYEGKLRAMYDAADLLIEASNALEAIPQPLGEPMEIIEAKPLPSRENDERKAAREPAIEAWAQPHTVPRAVWTSAGDLPAPRPGKPSYRPPRVCPECDSRANKRVYRDGHKLMLACPVCSTTWEYRP